VSNSEMSNFLQDQGNQGVGPEAYIWYAAQLTPQIDAEIVKKGHFWMDTR
jgi:hypothetical protein